MVINQSEGEFLKSGGFSHYSMEVWVSPSEVARVYETKEDYEEALDALNYFNVKGMQTYQTQTGCYIITHELSKDS